MILERPILSSIVSGKAVSVCENQCVLGFTTLRETRKYLSGSKSSVVTAPSTYTLSQGFAWPAMFVDRTVGEWERATRFPSE